MSASRQKATEVARSNAATESAKSVEFSCSSIHDQDWFVEEELINHLSNLSWENKE